MKEMAFQQKHLEKRIFHCQNDWSGCGPAGQFLLFESALRFPAPILSGMPDFFWAQDSGFHKQKISQISEYGHEASYRSNFQCSDFLWLGYSHKAFSSYIPKVQREKSNNPQQKLYKVKKECEQVPE